MKYIFPLLGVALIGLWFMKVTTFIEGGSIKLLSQATIKYQYLALLGFGCFWIIPALNWFRAGSKVNFSEAANALIEDAYPTFGRQIPAWAHIIRFLGFGAFIYFTVKAVKVLNDEIFFNWNYFFPAAMSAATFFLLPFLFQRKTQ